MEQPYMSLIDPIGYFSFPTAQQRILANCSNIRPGNTNAMFAILTIEPAQKTIFTCAGFQTLPQTPYEALQCIRSRHFSERNLGSMLLL